MSDDLEIMTDQGEGGQGQSQGQPQSAVHEPGKLMRIAVMLREMQEEVRRADVDEAGLERLRVVYGRAVDQLSNALSGELRDELTALNFPVDDTHSASESEIFIAQAQLIGWLEGLFQGIQAAIFSQQQQARQQLEQMRGLPPGAQGQRPQEGARQSTGQYL